MKYLLLILMLALVGCSNPLSSGKKYAGVSCDKYGCDHLAVFKDEAECRDLLYSIMRLHKLLKDKPSKVLRCVEQ